MTKISRRALVMVAFGLFACAQSCFGQAVRNGLGDSTSIVNPDKVFTFSGNPHSIGNFSNTSSGQDTGAFATRHLRSGDSSGIGGSFLGTTNVTSESSPASSSRVPENMVRALIPTSGIVSTSSQSAAFSDMINRPVSTSLPSISPDISREWNPTTPNAAQTVSPATSIDFVGGHKRMPALDGFSKTVTLPSLDNY